MRIAGLPERPPGHPGRSAPILGAWLAACAGCYAGSWDVGAPPSPARTPDPVAAPAGDPWPGDPDVEVGPPGGPADEPYAAPAATPDPVFSAPARKPLPHAPVPSSAVEALLDAHNRARARHCAAPLTWSPKLAQVAQQWANALRDKGCAFGHSGGSFGENLAAGTSGALDAEAVVKMWYDEVAQYNFKSGGFSSQTGHFTQVVWRGTARVGCGRSQCKGMDIWVCEYDPPGNWEGQYRQNVLPTSCPRR